MVDFDKIKKIFEDCFELDNYEVLPSSEFENVPGWDSLGHMKLIAMLEEEFDIDFELDEIIGVDTVKKIFELVNNKT